MGAIYCEISKISIEYGQECVLIPLIKRIELSGTYWRPALLPIYIVSTDNGSVELSDNDIKLNYYINKLN